MTGKALNAKMAWARKLKLSSKDDFLAFLFHTFLVWSGGFAFASVRA